MADYRQQEREFEEQMRGMDKSHQKVMQPLSRKEAAAINRRLVKSFSLVVVATVVAVLAVVYLL